MKLVYRNETLKLQCTDPQEAQKLFGGNKELAYKLVKKISLLESFAVLKDVIALPSFRFHTLRGDRDGYFSMNVKTQNEPWRIIIRPLNQNEEPFNPCHIDEIASIVEIIEIREVSKHYE